MRAPPLTFRILGLILAVQLALIAFLAAGSLDRLRRDIAAETRMAAATARNLVLATIGTMAAAVPPDRLMAQLPERLTEPRHARIGVRDALDGSLRQPPGPADPPRAAPAWFARTVAPDLHETRLPVVLDGRPRGYVLITGDPAELIARAFRDMQALMVLALLAAALQAGLILLALRHALRPVGAIAARLADLARGDLAGRLGPLAAGPDLAPLARNVDRLAEVLEQAGADRRRLQGQIVLRADAERKAIARDLHDEMGPCLFGLRVEADALAQATDPAVAGSAAQIAAIAEQIAGINRALLDDLRPVAIGQLPLDAVLRDYVDDLARRFPGTRFQIDIAAALPEPDEAVALTLFRILQEGTTNALRHAGAGLIRVQLWTDPAHWRIRVADDGRGIAPGVPEGAGLTGMRERITLLGGDLRLSSGPGGTKVEASLPRQGDWQMTQGQRRTG